MSETSLLIMIQLFSQMLLSQFPDLYFLRGMSPRPILAFPLMPEETLKTNGNQEYWLLSFNSQEILNSFFLFPYLNDFPQLLEFE